MTIEWMSQEEFSSAIPPTFDANSFCLGGRLLERRPPQLAAAPEHVDDSPYLWDALRWCGRAAGELFFLDAYQSDSGGAFGFDIVTNCRTTPRWRSLEVFADVLRSLGRLQITQVSEIAHVRDERLGGAYLVLRYEGPSRPTDVLYGCSDADEAIALTAYLLRVFDDADLYVARRNS